MKRVEVLSQTVKNSIKHTNLELKRTLKALKPIELDDYCCFELEEAQDQALKFTQAVEQLLEQAYQLESAIVAATNERIARGPIDPRD